MFKLIKADICATVSVPFLKRRMISPSVSINDNFSVVGNGLFFKLKCSQKSSHKKKQAVVLHKKPQDDLNLVLSRTKHLFELIAADVCTTVSVPFLKQG